MKKGTLTLKKLETMCKIAQSFPKYTGVECPECKEKTIVSERTIQLQCKCGSTWTPLGGWETFQDRCAREGVWI